MAKRWTSEEDTFLREIYPSSSKIAILSKIPKDWTAIRRRAHRLNLHRDAKSINADRKIRHGPRKDSWSDKEKILLREIFENNIKEFIQDKFPNRKWTSILHNARSLNLHRNPKFRKESAINNLKKAPAPIDLWTMEENSLLKQTYEISSKSDIFSQFPGRTWKAIRCQAVKLGLCRTVGRTKNDPILSALWKKPETQEKFKQIRFKKRGFEYPAQDPTVREKVRIRIQEKYGVNNVFQAEEIKKKSRETNLREHGAENPQQNKEIHAQTISTNIKRYGVDNLFKRVDMVQQGMIKKYGVPCPLQHPKIKEKQRQTNTTRYGFPTPAQNPDIKKKLVEISQSDVTKEKKYRTFKKNKSFSASSEEIKFYEYLKSLDSRTKHHKLHPTTKHVIDFYLPTYDLWVQYDGIYWHGKKGINSSHKHFKRISKTIETDKFQNDNISNLIRFWSDEVEEAKKDGTIIALIENRIKEKIRSLSTQSCFQYRKKLELYDEDIETLPFNPSEIKASQFELSNEMLTPEIIEFIEKYEWLGTVGVSPKWIFTAKYRGILGGVVLINEPSAYSKILGEKTNIDEALIQRGASASWAPKNTGSRLIMFSCRWMINNTNKRAFVGYADPSGHERGIIYQACGFDYLGDKFGSNCLYRHVDFDRDFSSQNLRRTSSFKKWCRINKITPQKIWFKKNGFKNLQTIPLSIKNSWYAWIKKTLHESKKILIEKKMKYAKVLGKDKREKVFLQGLKTYENLPYPQNKKFKESSFHQIGKTKSRKSSAKIQFLIDNYGKMSRPVLAKNLNETMRWIKRQIFNLAREKKITIKSKAPKNIHQIFRHM